MDSRAKFKVGDRVVVKAVGSGMPVRGFIDQVREYRSGVSVFRVQAPGHLGVFLQDDEMELDADPPSPGQTVVRLLSDGWSFSYDDATRFVGASHLNGGKMSICEIVVNPVSGVSRKELGEAIAAWLQKGM